MADGYGLRLFRSLLADEPMAYPEEVVYLDGTHREFSGHITIVPCHPDELKVRTADTTRRDAVLAGYDPEPCQHCGKYTRVSSGQVSACGTCGARWTRENKEISGTSS